MAEPQDLNWTWIDLLKPSKECSLEVDYVSGILSFYQRIYTCVVAPFLDFVFNKHFPECLGPCRWAKLSDVWANFVTLIVWKLSYRQWGIEKNSVYCVVYFRVCLLFFLPLHATRNQYSCFIVKRLWMLFMDWMFAFLRGESICTSRKCH